MKISSSAKVLWAAAVCLFLAGAPALAQASFSNQVVTTQAPPSTGCVRPTPATSFLTTDNTVYLYFEAIITTSDTLTNNWLAPDGTVLAASNWPASSGNSCFTGASLSISNLPTSQLGSWQARVYDNGQLFFSVSFSVSAPAVSGPTISAGGVVNGASFKPGPVAPGSIVSIFGTVLASGTAQATMASLPTTLQSTQVLINGIAAPLFYVSPSQINAQVPWEVTGLFTTDLAVQVISNGSRSNVVAVALAITAPGIFVIAHDADNTAVTSAKPAVPGEYLRVYCTGLGTVTNQPPTGAPAPLSPLSYTAQNSTVTVAGLSAYVPFSGLSPGFVGLYQVNAQVPANAVGASAASLVLSNGGSSATAVLAVQSGGVQQFTLTATTAGNGSGSISANPPGPSYAAGTVVTLTATPNTASTFAGWSGACSGTGGCTVTMSSNQSVTATFNLTGNSTVTVYQTGFEPPTFSPGTLNGQNYWSINGMTSSTVIETTTVKTGAQAVGITSLGSTTGVVGAYRYTTYNAANQILTFSIDAEDSATGAPSFWTAFDTQYNSSPPNIDLNIDQSGQIHIFIMGTDHPTGVSITRGVWNNYKLQVNFINDTVSGFYNGTLVLQGAPFSSTGTTLGLYAFDAQGGSPLGGTDSIYFDNLSVTASASTGATLMSLAVTPGNSTMQAETTLQLAATGTYGDGSTQNLTNAVSWSSSNTAIATISSSGLVTGVSAGNTTITATSGTVTGTTGLTVGSSTQGSATLTISTPGTGSGSVSSSPTGSSCGSGCLSFAAGTVVTLTATPNTGSTFAGWSGACSGTGGCTVTMSSNQTVTATFSVTSNPTLTISISPATATVQTGGAQQFTATVTGSSNATVTWSVVGVQGGNSTVGTISTTGLYTAPSAVPTTNPVTVTDTSVADTTKSASATVTITAVSSELQISSLSEISANPFDPLTITGTGFSEGTLAISVVFTPENGDPAVMIPVAASSATSIKVMVPTFSNLTTGAFSSETVDVQVVEFSSTTTYLSNTIKALPVGNLPPVPSGVPAGAMTAELLSAALNISVATQNVATGNTSLSNVSAALAQLDTDIYPLISAANTIASNPTQTVNITTANGTTIVLDAQILAQSDQLAQALLAAIVTQGSIPIQSSSPDCPAASGNATFDSNLCSTQIYFQTYSSQAPAVQVSLRSKFAARSELTLAPPGEAMLDLFANLTLEIAAEASGGPVVAGLYSLVGAPLVSTAVSSLGVNQETPSGTAVVGGMGIYLLDQAVYFGVPVLNPYLGLLEVAYAIDQYSPPPTGTLLSSGVATFMPGGRTFLDQGTGTATTLLVLPDRPQGAIFDTTTLVLAPSSGFTLALSTNGSGSGSITSFPTGTSIPAGTTVGLTAVPSNISTFAGWGGACSGTGACSVTMNADQSVSATFTAGATDAVTPSITLGSVGGCAGGTLSGTVNVTAAPGVTWTAFGEGVVISNVSPASGTGSGVVNFTITALPFIPGPNSSPCSLQFFQPDNGVLWVAFSDLGIETGSQYLTTIVYFTDIVPDGGFVP